MLYFTFFSLYWLAILFYLTQMKIKDILQHVESIAPTAYQEPYDNARLITGNSNWQCTGVLTTLDCIECIVEEAIEKKCNLIVAHHPIVFSGLKSITGKNYIERTLIKAIKHDIAIYAIHTNLDNVQQGVNAMMADKLQLYNQQILLPKKQLLKKLYTFCPTEKAEEVRQALFNAGAGQLGNYNECSFNLEGTGTFKANEGAQPYVGKTGELHREKETKIEVIFTTHLQGKVVAALHQAHPYETVAYDVVLLENEHPQVGSGMLGVLEKPVEILSFLQQIKQTFNCGSVRYTKPHKEMIGTVALCGGAGSFLLKAAKAHKADIFITADYKYHQFFDADNQIVIADIGHFESEQFTMQLLYNILTQKFSNFAVFISEQNTNPVNYL